SSRQGASVARTRERRVRAPPRRKHRPMGLRGPLAIRACWLPDRCLFVCLASCHTLLTGRSPRSTVDEAGASASDTSAKYSALPGITFRTSWRWSCTARLQLVASEGCENTRDHFGRAGAIERQPVFPPQLVNNRPSDIAKPRTEQF